VQETRTSGLAGIIISACAVMMTVACILWNIDAPTRLGVAFLTEQYMALQLGLALCIVYLGYGLGGQEIERPSLLGWILAVIGLCVLLYTAARYDMLLAEQAYRPPILTVVGTVVVFWVLEGVRRRAGWVLFTIVAVFLVYALFANKVPGALIGQAMTPTQLVQYVGFDPSAVFSTPLAVGTTVVLLFVFFGHLLFAAGGGEFFTDLALSATGRARGGSAKVSVVASALFGSISGSAVSNVVTTGVVTIPLMRKGGYSRRDAGAIEAIASTGGQLTPPIMGAAAFLMAEFLEVSYFTVAAAAVLPAVLYYLSVFIQVDLIAGRDGISVVGEDVPDMKGVLRDGWHFILPFAVLLVSLFWWRLDPEVSALFSAVAIIVVGFARGYKTEKLTPALLLAVFIKTGTSMIDLILIVAAAGFVIGILNATGLGFALTLLLVNVVGQNLVVILFASAFICILLGMGMPTSGVYVLLAALVAPSIVEAGVDPLAAHLFILYFGMMSMITPPVALAAFAAAAITKSNPFSTGLASMRIGWAAYIIPFVFVGTPTLLLVGDTPTIVLDFVKAAVGVFAIAVAVVGYLGRKLPLWQRAGFVVLGAGCLPLGFAAGVWSGINIAAVVAALLLAAAVLLQARRVVPTAGRP